MNIEFRKNFFITLLLINIGQSVFAQNGNDQISIIDVSHYAIELKVNDSTDRIEIRQYISFYWLDTTKKISFDLASLNNEGKGMLVVSFKDGNSTLKFRHEKDKIYIESLEANGRREVELELIYSGIPIDGLVIGKNKYDDRTFFGDNWPNRAHNWFACIDHPSDKATVNFRVQAPSHYEVVANGIFVGKQNVNELDDLYEYSSNVPLPTKVMVVGIADFEIKQLGNQSGVDVSSWVYPENAEKSFYDFDLAPQILQFFVDYIGPYEYEKLANVQSTTRYGGMENAGCIFYDENAINGKRTSETLLAHEIAHQWFGNSASEKMWQDIWLSEGFATYFTNLYIEKFKGAELFQRQLEKDRAKVIAFYKYYPNPVVDTAYSDLMNLLNENSYQKGGWVLHMLRRKLGDEIFKKGIIAYYQKYRMSNASTKDFQQVMEEVSGQDLNLFFKQWLYNGGHPILKTEAKITKKRFVITLEQKQTEQVFNFPLLIELKIKNGEKVYEMIQMNEQKQSFEFVTKKKVKSYTLDPNVNLLFEIDNY